MSKKALVLGKNIVIVSYFGSNSAFKIQFQEYLEEKTPKYFTAELFILVLLTKCLSKCPNSTKPRLPFIMHLEKVFRPPLCESFTRAFFLLPNKHQPTRKNYVLRTSLLRTSPEDVLTSSGRPHLVSYVTPREAFAAVCPWDVLRTLF